MTMPDLLRDEYGRPVYQRVLRAEPGVRVSLFTIDMRQITEWVRLDDALLATWPPGTVSVRTEVAFAVLMRNGVLRTVELHDRPILTYDTATHLDLSRFERLLGVRR